MRRGATGKRPRKPRPTWNAPGLVIVGCWTSRGCNTSIPAELSGSRGPTYKAEAVATVIMRLWLTFCPLPENADLGARLRPPASCRGGGGLVSATVAPHLGSSVAAGGPAIKD